MNRRQQWALAALALAFAAGAARAQTGALNSGSSAGSCSGAAPAMTWKFTTTRDGGEARLQMQAGPGATATCESITLRMGGTPVTLTTDGQKVRIRSGPGKRGLRIEASAEGVGLGGARGEVLTLAGPVQASFERDGQHTQVIKGKKVTLNLATGAIEVAGNADVPAPAAAAVSFDFGVPLVVPAAEKEKEQTFNYIIGFSR
jgi:hypothetical protein